MKSLIATKASFVGRSGEVFAELEVFGPFDHEPEPLAATCSGEEALPRGWEFKIQLGFSSAR
jgi:hypothetical protein